MTIILIQEQSRADSCAAGFNFIREIGGECRSLNSIERAQALAVVF